jgi:hypothetical protein
MSASAAAVGVARLCTDACMEASSNIGRQLDDLKFSLHGRVQALLWRRNGMFTSVFAAGCAVDTAFVFKFDPVPM